VRQHTEGMVGSIMWVLLEIQFSFTLWKNFENPLRIDKVIAKSLVYYFCGTQYISSQTKRNKVLIIYMVMTMNETATVEYFSCLHINNNCSSSQSCVLEYCNCDAEQAVNQLPFCSHQQWQSICQTTCST